MDETRIELATVGLVLLAKQAMAESFRLSTPLNMANTREYWRSRCNSRWLRDLAYNTPLPSNAARSESM